jgi:hypothetical protein
MARTDTPLTSAATARSGLHTGVARPLSKCNAWWRKCDPGFPIFPSIPVISLLLFT